MNLMLTLVLTLDGKPPYITNNKDNTVMGCLSTIILWWFNWLGFLTVFSPLWGSIGFVTHSPYCGGSGKTWREVSSCDERRRAVKNELDIGRTAKNWASVGSWRPPVGGRRSSDEVGPLMAVSVPRYIPYLDSWCYYTWKRDKRVEVQEDGVKCTYERAMALYPYCDAQNSIFSRY